MHDLYKLSSLTTNREANSVMLRLPSTVKLINNYLHLWNPNIHYSHHKTPCKQEVTFLSPILSSGTTLTYKRHLRNDLLSLNFEIKCWTHSEFLLYVLHVLPNATYLKHITLLLQCKVYISHVLLYIVACSRANGLVNCTAAIQLLADFRLAQKYCAVLGALAKLRKASINFVMSVHPTVHLSVRIEKQGFHWTDFDEIWYLKLLRKFVTKTQVSAKCDKNNGYFTWRRLQIYENISPNSS